MFDFAGFFPTTVLESINMNKSRECLTMNTQEWLWTAHTCRACAQYYTESLF